jgi:extradiol dioxygenase family protein
MNIAPFHFAFFVRDLESTRRFYGDILGCNEGRSTDTWVDFDFFGNQISAHTTGTVTSTQNTGKVEDLLVPMPHFGALLGWEEFQAVAARIREAGHPFILEPRIRYAGQPGEQATMFLLDPSGNALEFKSFRNSAHVFTA